MISLIFGKRTLPITWLVVRGCKGHLPEDLHLDLLSKLQAILPEGCQTIFLGDGEFDGVKLQESLQPLGLRYVCRTAKNTQLYEDGLPFTFVDLLVRPGDQISIPNVYFTPLTVFSVNRPGEALPAYRQPLQNCGGCHQIWVLISTSPYASYTV